MHHADSLEEGHLYLSILFRQFQNSNPHIYHLHHNIMLGSKAHCDLYRVLVQDEYLDYFSRPDRVESGPGAGYDGPAKEFRNQIYSIYFSIGVDGPRLTWLSKKYMRTETCFTVGYELISDEDLNSLKADDIATIYMAEIYHERWGGAFAALFEHPFFLKSLRRLKTLVEPNVPAGGGQA